MTPSFSRILVPTDFSEGSRHALEYAVALAARLGASLHVLHVREDPVVTALWAEGYVDTESLAAARDAEATRDLQAELTAAGAGAATWDVTAGPVSATIVRVARDRDADLIVMGTHGRTGMAHVLMGSIAEQVMRAAGCPVLTIRTTPEAVARTG